MMFSGLILFVLGIGVIAYLFGWRPDFLQQSSNKSSSNQSRNFAVEILEERYARGEIDEDEYLRRKRNLQQ